MNATCVRPGPPSLAWLSAKIIELKGKDPLTPITVVVSSNHVGLSIRRTLARTGYANVRFGVMGRLVEPLGASDLASAGRSPLTQPAEEAAILEAIRRKGQGFGEVGSHPALVKTLRELFRELRAAELDSGPLAELGSWGLMAEVALAVFREYLAVIRAANLYDDHDLFASATAALSGTRTARLVQEVGSVLVYSTCGPNARGDQVPQGALGPNLNRYRPYVPRRRHRRPPVGGHRPSSWPELARTTGSARQGPGSVSAGCA